MQTTTTALENTTEKDPNNVIMVQRGIVSSGTGDDTFVLTSALVDDNAEIIISDANGNNTIQLISGLTIESSTIASNTLLLTLNNGATVTVLDASNFTFELGGDPLIGTEGNEANYSSFVTEVLDVSGGVPESGIVSGGSIGITNDSGNGLSNDTLTPDTSGVVNATTGTTEVISFSTAELNSGQYTVNGFTAGEDTLKLSGLTGASGSKLSDLSGDSIDTGVIGVQYNEITGDTLVNLGNDSSQEVISILLSGVSDPSQVDVQLV